MLIKGSPEKKYDKKDSTENKKTRRLQLQATVKRFQIDFHRDLEGQHSLISLIFIVKSFRTDKMNHTVRSTFNLEFFIF